MYIMENIESEKKKIAQSHHTHKKYRQFSFLHGTVLTDTCTHWNCVLTLHGSLVIEIKSVLPVLLTFSFSSKLFFMYIFLKTTNLVYYIVFSV